MPPQLGQFEFWFDSWVDVNCGISALEMVLENSSVVIAISIIRNNTGSLQNLFINLYHPFRLRSTRRITENLQYESR